MAYEHFQITKEELESVAGKKDIWNTLVSLPLP